MAFLGLAGINDHAVPVQGIQPQPAPQNTGPEADAPVPVHLIPPGMLAQANDVLRQLSYPALPAPRRLTARGEPPDYEPAGTGLQVRRALARAGLGTPTRLGTLPPAAPSATTRSGAATTCGRSADRTPPTGYRGRPTCGDPVGVVALAQIREARARLDAVRLSVRARVSGLWIGGCPGPGANHCSPVRVTIARGDRAAPDVTCIWRDQTSSKYRDS
jgi:hypothetical protein